MTTIHSDECSIYAVNEQLTEFKGMFKGGFFIGRTRDKKLQEQIVPFLPKFSCSMNLELITYDPNKAAVCEILDAEHFIKKVESSGGSYKR